MAIRVYKPTSPGRRSMSVSTFEEITKKKPEKSLIEPLKKHAVHLGEPVGVLRAVALHGEEEVVGMPARGDAEPALAQVGHHALDFAPAFGLRVAHGDADDVVARARGPTEHLDAQRHTELALGDRGRIDAGERLGQRLEERGRRRLRHDLLVIPS